MGLMSIGARLRRRIAPLHGAMSYRDYQIAKRTAPLTVGETKLFGSPIWFSNAHALFYSYDEIFRNEVYAFNARSLSPVIIDAGANIGLSIIYFKKRFPDCRIVAFEPDPSIFDLLKKNVSVRSYKDVDLRQEAAWIRDEDLTFYSEGSLAGSIKVDYVNAGNKNTIKAIRFKDVLSKFDKIDFLKIDIEGAESEVLSDVESELNRCEFLFFEYHSTYDTQQELGELLSLVTRNGFRYVINGTHGSKLPFVERCTNPFDLQLNVSCFRSA